jgi:cell division protein FtsZ
VVAQVPEQHGNCRYCQRTGILTVGIVTAPFGFEGKKKIEQGFRGIEEMRQNCDTVLVIVNDKLREIYGNLTISQAFAQADNVLPQQPKVLLKLLQFQICKRGL